MVVLHMAFQFHSDDGHYEAKGSNQKLLFELQNFLVQQKD